MRARHLRHVKAMRKFASFACLPGPSRKPGASPPPPETEADPEPEPPPPPLLPPDPSVIKRDAILSAYQRLQSPDIDVSAAAAKELRQAVRVSRAATPDAPSSHARV